MRNLRILFLAVLSASSAAWAQSLVFAVDRNLFQPALDGVLNVTFSSPLDAEGELDIYNSAGEQVRRLFPEGPAEVMANVPVVSSWDGLNQGGNEVASGVYLLRLRLGEDVRIRKVLVIR